MITRYTGSKKEQRRKKRHRKVRSKISGTAERPRVCVTRSLKHMYVQAIDDVAESTIVAAGDKELTKADQSKSKGKKAYLVGELLGKKLQKRQIETAVFDRGGYQYHGRVKALADGVRAAGVNI